MWSGRQTCCGCFFSSRRRHTRCSRDWSSDVCSSDLQPDLLDAQTSDGQGSVMAPTISPNREGEELDRAFGGLKRSEEHTSELQSRLHLVCRLLLEKKKKKKNTYIRYK